MFERFTAHSRRAVVLAQEEARMLNHSYIGTEHLLLALIRDEGIAGTALAGTGVTRDEATTHIVEIIGRGHSMPSGHIPFTPRAKSVLEEALRTALRMGHGYIGTEHLILGLLAGSPKSVAAQALMCHGVAPATVARRVIDLMNEAQGRGTPKPKPEHGFALSA
jgi:ATP-dependent Clp protease ATP-binding subunit ClpC